KSGERRIRNLQCPGFLDGGREARGAAGQKPGGCSQESGRGTVRLQLRRRGRTENRHHSLGDGGGGREKHSGPSVASHYSAACLLHGDVPHIRSRNRTPEGKTR